MNVYAQLKLLIFEEVKHRALSSVSDGASLNKNLFRVQKTTNYIPVRLSPNTRTLRIGMVEQPIFLRINCDFKKISKMKVFVKFGYQLQRCEYWRYDDRMWHVFSARTSLTDICGLISDISNKIMIFSCTKY